MLSSRTIVALFLWCAATSTVLALPFELEERNNGQKLAECTTRVTGKLTTVELWDGIGEGSPTGVWKNLAFNTNNELAFYLNKTRPFIEAKFQACYPNYGGFKNPKNGTRFAGRIYIQSLKKCLAVKNPNSSGPYAVEWRNCGPRTYGPESVPYNFELTEFNDGTRYFSYIGKTNAKLTRVQGGPECKEEGRFGYSLDRFNLPITGPGNKLKLVCNNGEGVGPVAEIRWSGSRKPAKKN